MFRELVVNPIDPISVEYVQYNIKRIYSEPDYSLTCLGLAMLKKRIPDYKGIAGKFISYSMDSALEDFRSCVDNIDSFPLFCYYKCNTGSVEPDYINKHFPDFKEKKNISTFVKDKTGNECTVLYSETKNAVGIFINSADYRIYHLMLSFISLYYPSLFKDNPLDENDYEVIKSLNDKTQQRFYTAIKKMVQPYAFEFRKMQLCGFMKKLHEDKINAALGKVNEYRTLVKDCEENYSRAIVELRTAIVRYEGMKATENYDDPEQELVEYLAGNNDIHNLSLNNNYICFSVTTLLNNYNVQAWETFSERGYIYDGEYDVRLPDVFSDRHNRQILFDSIFSDDPLFRVRMAGNYSLDLNECRVRTSDMYDYSRDDPMFINYVPNPHIARFACLGGYKERIIPLLRDRNYIAAIELCIASAGSVNLDETTQTFRPFLGWILTNENKILVQKDGTAMTPKEALIWLLDKENENATD